MVLYHFLFFSIKKQNVVLPSWTRVVWVRWMYWLCRCNSPVPLAKTWTGRIVEAENHRSGVSRDLHCLPISVRLCKWSFATAFRGEYRSSFFYGRENWATEWFSGTEGHCVHFTWRHRSSLAELGSWLGSPAEVCYRGFAWQVHVQFSSNVESQVRRHCFYWRHCTGVRKGMGFDRQCAKKLSLFNLLWIFFDFCLELSFVAEYYLILEKYINIKNTLWIH